MKKLIFGMILLLYSCSGGNNTKEEFVTYEQAQESCLEKLCEIVESKK